MILKKETNSTVLADSVTQLNAKVTFNAISVDISENNYMINVVFSYLTDENDPDTIQYTPCDPIVYDTAGLNTEEDALGAFSGTHFTDKVLDMVDKLMVNLLNTELCYGINATGWSNVSSSV